jgi:hypothetical protein
MHWDRITLLTITGARFGVPLFLISTLAPLLRAIEEH